MVNVLVEVKEWGQIKGQCKCATGLILTHHGPLGTWGYRKSDIEDLEYVGDDQGKGSAAVEHGG